MSTREPKAVVQLAGNDLFVGFSPSGHAVTIDTDRARNSAPSPMELLLVALDRARAWTWFPFSRRSVRGSPTIASRCAASGERTIPGATSEWKCITLSLAVTFSERSVAQAIELSEQKYCSVAATLRPTAEIVSSFEIIELPTDDR